MLKSDIEKQKSEEVVQKSCASGDAAMKAFEAVRLWNLVVTTRVADR